MQCYAIPVVHFVPLWHASVNKPNRQLASTVDMIVADTDIAIRFQIRADVLGLVGLYGLHKLSRHYNL